MFVYTSTFYQLFYSSNVIYSNNSNNIEAETIKVNFLPVSRLIRLMFHNSKNTYGQLYQYY